MFKLYAALALVAALIGTIAFHKHVVHERDTARAEVTRLQGVEKQLRVDVKESERLRGVENKAATADLKAAQTSCTARVAEARRAAGAIKTIMEKPRATDPVTLCPVPDRIPAGELRDALQPAPFHRAPAPVAR